MDFKDLLNGLHPPGVFSDAPASIFQGELAVVAAAFKRANDNAAALKDEMHPETATASIADWERNYGLTPGPDDPLQTRRQRVVAKMNAQGGLSRQYFIGFAASLGYAITIDEYEPFMSDIGCAGDSCSEDEIFFAWLITVLNSGNTKVLFCVDDGCAGDSLIWWPDDTYFEGRINGLKRASTVVFFEYI